MRLDQSIAAVDESGWVEGASGQAVILVRFLGH